jgi:hypothetical protein
MATRHVIAFRDGLKETGYIEGENLTLRSEAKLTLTNNKVCHLPRCQSALSRS